VENEPKTLETPGPTLAIVDAEELKLLVTNAFRSMAQTMLSMRRQMEATDGMLKQIIEERSQLVDLVTHLSGQVQTFAKLQDSDHSAIEVLLMSQGTPKGRDVN
jgi:hypothetical protein